MAGRGGSRPGAGRKAQGAGEKRRHLSTTISVASWEKLRALADQSGLSLSRVLDGLIAQSAEREVALDGLHEEGDRS